MDVDIADDISVQFEDLLTEFHESFEDQEVYAFTYQVRRGLISLGSISLVGDRARIVRIRCSRNGVSCHVQKGDNIVEHSPSQIAIYFATCCYCQKLLLPVEVKHFNEHNENKDDDLVWATQKMTECMHRNPKFQYNPDAIDPFQRFVRQFEAVFAQFREELADESIIVRNKEDELWYLADILDIQIDSSEMHVGFCVKYNGNVPPNLQENFPVLSLSVSSDFGFCDHCGKYMPTGQLNDHKKFLSRCFARIDKNRMNQ